MNKQYLQAYVEKAEKEGVLEVAIASDEKPDREGDIVKVDGWDLTNFKKNAPLLWSHNAGFGEQRPAIGRVENIKVEGKKLTFRPVFDMEDEFAASIYRKFKNGFLNAFSVGFIPLDRDPIKQNIIKSAELLEISAVNVPANPRALAVLRSAGMPVAKSFEAWEKGELENPEADLEAVVEVDPNELKEEPEETPKEAVEEPKNDELREEVAQLSAKLDQVLEKLNKPDSRQVKINQDVKVFSSEDLRDSLAIVDKAVQLALKKYKTVRGGE